MPNRKTGQIVIMSSFKGGTGKTIVAVNIGYYLSKKGYKVLLIDGDLRASSIDKIIPLMDDLVNIKTWVDYLDRAVELKDIIVTSEFPNLDVIYCARAIVGQSYMSGKDTDKWVGNALRQIQKIRKGLEYQELDYDFVIIDNENGITPNSLNLNIVANVACLVVRPNRYGIDGMSHLVSEAFEATQDVANRQDFLIWNQVDSTPEYESEIAQILEHSEKFFEISNIRPLIRIPYDKLLSISMLIPMMDGMFGVTKLMQQHSEKIVQGIGLI